MDIRIWDYVEKDGIVNVHIRNNETGICGAVTEDIDFLKLRMPGLKTSEDIKKYMLDKAVRQAQMPNCYF
jgi:hypothetical protein